MGLSSRRQWVIASEANLADWNDPEIIALKSGGWTYGVMIRQLLDEVRTKYQAVYGERGAAETVVNRR